MGNTALLSNTTGHDNTANGNGALYSNITGSYNTANATVERASEGILSLRPVTFHYKTDTEGTPQFGLIAEEVAKVNPSLVLPDKEGKPYTVRYEAVNAMLLNEFLKEHRKSSS
jgi:Chaperone of endosialidase